MDTLGFIRGAVLCYVMCCVRCCVMFYYTVLSHIYSKAGYHLAQGPTAVALCKRSCCQVGGQADGGCGGAGVSPSLHGMRQMHRCMGCCSLKRVTLWLCKGMG